MRHSGRAISSLRSARLDAGKFPILPDTTLRPRADETRKSRASHPRDPSYEGFTEPSTPIARVQAPGEYSRVKSGELRDDGHGCHGDELFFGIVPAAFFGDPGVLGPIFPTVRRLPFPRAESTSFIPLVDSPTAICLNSSITRPAPRKLKQILLSVCLPILVVWPLRC